MNSKYKLEKYKTDLGEVTEILGYLQFSEGDLRKFMGILKSNKNDGWASSMLEEIEKQFKKYDKAIK